VLLLCLVGDSLTVADLALYSRVMSFKLGKYDNIPGDIVDGAQLRCQQTSQCDRQCVARLRRLLLPTGFPKVSALYERVLKHPKVAEWNAMPGH